LRSRKERYRLAAVEKGNQRQSDRARHAKYKGPPQKRTGKKGDEVTHSSF